MAKLISQFCLVVQLNLLHICIALQIPTYRHRSVSLTPEQNHKSGAAVYANQEVIINLFKNQWEIISESNEWFMHLHLDNSWGFNKYFGSTISITIDSSTIGGPQTFNEFIIGVTVPETNKYIALDLVWNNPNKILPFCDTSTYPITEMEDGYLSELSPFFNNTYAYDMKPESGAINNRQISFPMTIHFINYPKFSQEYGHYLYVQYSSDLSDFVQQCGFEPFETEKGLDLYFGINAETDEQLIALKSIRIEYTDENAPFKTTNMEILIPPDYATVNPKDIMKTLWSKYLGVWIVCILALMTCMTACLLLYCSKYEKRQRSQCQSPSVMCRTISEETTLMSVSVQHSKIQLVSATGTITNSTSHLKRSSNSAVTLPSLTPLTPFESEQSERSETNGLESWNQQSKFEFKIN